VFASLWRVALSFADRCCSGVAQTPVKGQSQTDFGGPPPRRRGRTPLGGTKPDLQGHLDASDFQVPMQTESQSYGKTRGFTEGRAGTAMDNKAGGDPSPRFPGSERGTQSANVAGRV